MTIHIGRTGRTAMAALMLAGPATAADAPGAAGGLAAAGQSAGTALDSAGRGDLSSAWLEGGRAFESGAEPAASPVLAGLGAQAGPGLAGAGVPAERPSAVADVPAPEPAGGKAPEGGVLAGVGKGASEGAMFGFGLVLTPAVSLLSEAFGRDMSHTYDGPRSDNGGSAWRWAAGFALAAVLYIPALVAGGLGGIMGGVAGGVSEAVSPGSTKDWCGECRLYDNR